MGQILHGSARTTEAVRQAIQNSQERIARLARRYNLPAGFPEGVQLHQTSKNLKRAYILRESH